MNLNQATALYMLATYFVGGAVAFFAVSAHWTVSLIVAIVALVLLSKIKNSAVNSLRDFLYSGIASEASRLCYVFIEEALTLLNKDRKEDLKALLLEASSGAEDTIREVHLKYGGAPIEAVEVMEDDGS
jgi:hypothetical protein